MRVNTTGVGRSLDVKAPWCRSPRRAAYSSALERHQRLSDYSITRMYKTLCPAHRTKKLDADQTIVLHQVTYMVCGDAHAAVCTQLMINTCTRVE
jgi:hypothetical protein